MDKNLMAMVLNILKKDDRLWNDEKTELNQTLLLDLIDKIDEVIINLLLQVPELRKRFFVRIKDVYVFRTNEFSFFIEESKVDNSYTAYKNRIGLSDGRRFLKDTNDIVLDFPFKDCVLEGGQSTEEGTDTYFEYSDKTDKYEEKQAKRKEIFFNQVLAHDEIDRLFDEKALVNWKRYTKDGEQEVNEIQRNEDGTIKENLIIKGNNLLALHSLKKQFAGKIKLVYIDPPYNTGSDSFGYNDNFNHSTWLTFMKNRLEIAKDLLADDGTIFVQLDWHEAHYVKILMDYIFGRDHLINEIIWCYAGPGSPKMKQFNRKHDTIFWYKNGNNWTFNKDDIRIPYKDPNQSLRKAFDAGDGWTEKDLKILRERGKVPEDWWEFSVAARLRVDGKDRTGYLTEKPLKLMERIIKSASNEGDVILDFFAGAGTTGYVANNLKRQFILVEQLEDTQRKLKTRFEDIDYVYLELAKWNEQAKEEIQNAKDLSALVKLFDTLYEKYFLNYNLKINEFKEKVIKEDNFKKLSLDEQKNMFLTMLDLNQMYVQESEMADKKYGISSEDQKLTNMFYEEVK